MFHIIDSKKRRNEQAEIFAVRVHAIVRGFDYRHERVLSIIFR